MDCNTCKESRKTVSYYVFEGEMVRMERMCHRWFIAWLITFVLLVCTVAGFVWYESQWEEVVTTEVTQENDSGYNNYIGNDGDIYNGETNGQNDKNP